MNIEEFIVKYGFYVCFFDTFSDAESFCELNSDKEFTYYFILRDGYYYVYKVYN